MNACCVGLPLDIYGQTSLILDMVIEITVITFAVILFLKWHEVVLTFTLVEYVRETTA